MKWLSGLAMGLMLGAPAHALSVTLDDFDPSAPLPSFEVGAGSTTFETTISGAFDFLGNLTGHPGYGFNFTISEGYQLVDVILGTSYTTGAYWTRLNVDLFKTAGPTPAGGTTILDALGVSQNGSLGLEADAYTHGTYQLAATYSGLTGGLAAGADVTAIVQVAPIPLPATLSMLLLGLLGLVAMRFARRSRDV